MDIKTEVTDEQLKDLLCSAFEGGSNYWGVHVTGRSYAEGLSYSDFCALSGKFNADPNNYWHPDQIIPTVPGCSLGLRGDNGGAATLNREALQHGLDLCAEKHPQHYADILEGNDDATTADVLLQLSLYGGVIYG